MSVLGSLVAKASQPRNVAGHTAWGSWGDASSTPTWSGADVTVASARHHLTVYGCARFIADGISTLPVDVYRRRADGSPQQVATPQLFRQPNTEHDVIAFLGQIIWSLLLDGNAFVYKQHSDGALTSLLVLDPSAVTVDRHRGRKVYRVGNETFTDFEISHIPAAMWPGNDKGMSPVEAARQTIGLGMSAQEYAARFYSNGAAVSGVLETDQSLDEGQARAVAKQFSRRHSGASKAHLPLVLEGGLTWKPTGLTNEQAQFLESRKFTAAQIAAEMFLIDPSEMGYPVEGASLTYANLEQRNARKVQVTFLPWITRLEAFLTTLTPRGQYVKLNVNGLLRGDMKTRYDSYAVGISNGFLTVTEARESEDRGPIEEAAVIPPKGVDGRPMSAAEVSQRVYHAYINGLLGRSEARQMIADAGANIDPADGGNP